MSKSNESQLSVGSSHCVDCNIEQGLDLLDPRVSHLLCNSFNDHPTLKVTEPMLLPNTKKIRIARSMESYNGAECSTSRYDASPSSEPNKQTSHLNVEDSTLSNSLQEGRTEFLQEWLNNGPALVCSEEHLYPEEILGTTISRNFPDDNIDLPINQF